MAIKCDSYRSIKLPKKGPLPRIEAHFEFNLLVTRK